ncbi:MAG: hypothetical protein IJG87_07060 [Ruminococcus sp.]|nr:hypothetical protein [Ruminococcus sp.]
MKRTISIILALMLLFSVLPLTAFAEEADLADTGAQEEIAETGGSELTNSMDLWDARIGLTYNYLTCPVYPYLRVGVTGGTGSYRYKWFYCGDTPLANGNRFATTTRGEIQVTSAGYYYCIVEDVETYKTVRTRTAQVAEMNLAPETDFRINGDNIEWKESLVESVVKTGEAASLDFRRSRYTIKLDRYDTSHNDAYTQPLVLKIERDKFTGKVSVRRAEGNIVFIDDYTNTYPVTYDSERRIYSMKVKPLVTGDRQYDDIHYSFTFFPAFYDNRDEFFKDRNGYTVETPRSSAKSLYNGEVHTYANEDHYGEVQIMENEYSVGSVIKANLNGGRWEGRESYLDIVWQRKVNGAWRDVGTGMNYTVKTADMGLPLRFYATPNFKGQIDNTWDQAIYWDDEKFWSNEVIIPVEDTVDITLTEPVVGVKSDTTVSFTDTYSHKYFELANDTLSGTGLDWYYVTAETSGIRNNVPFESGAKYSATVYFKVKDGYTVDPSKLTVYFNGKKSTDVRSRGSYIIASYDYKPIQPLATAGCTITAPAPGGKPDFNPVSLDTSKYTIGNVGWYNQSDSRSMTASDRFEKDKQYSIRVDFEPVGDTLFDKNTVFLINGEKMNENGTPGHMKKWYNLGYNGPVEQVDTVKIYIDVPAAGEHPDFYPLTEEPDKVRVTVDCWYLAEGDYPHLSAIDTFVEGKNYTVRLIVEGNTGYQVDTSYTTVYINDVKATNTYGYGVNYIGKSKSFAVASGSTVSGSVTSYLNASEFVTVKIVNKSNGAVVKSTTTTTGSYSIADVPNGSYILQASKLNHVDRDYEITVSGNTTQDVKICPIGDATNDGNVNMFDYNAVYKHVSKNPELADGSYQKACADVTGDGKVNMFDYNAIYKHVAKTNPLF